MDNNLVTELKIIDENGNIFDSGEYIIPLYQREFAWEYNHLEQLIKDIDSNKEGYYYLGSLVVYKKENTYEVIDGQQRLTALFLLLNCLGFQVNNNLKFSCRKKSNYTLEHIKEYINGKNVVDNDLKDEGIYQGMKILRELLGNCYKEFIEKLKKVIIYRIEVPEHTDLNHYFEIMNTRGEQLEQQDILKAKLMSYLYEDEDKEIFATIWNACSDMTGYVQLHFSKSNRDNLFGNNWNELQLKDEFDKIKSKIISHDKDNTTSTPNQNQEFTIRDIIKSDFKIEEDNISNKEQEDTRIRFESIINFPYFLLHTLKVFMDTQDNNIPGLLDDKKLCSTFEDAIKEYNGSEKDFSKGFIICLLKTRFLFDKYIIKREYFADNSDGEWSLKSIDTSEQKTTKNAYAKNTYDKDKNTKNIMIQSALRVSYTSPKVMHWITELLRWLYYEHNEYTSDYAVKAEAIAKKPVREFLEEKNFSKGTYTPHIVLNFLDYVIWKKYQDKYKDFVFEFRNSIEHWYPQNPSEGSIPIWEDDENNSIDRFGNLCLVQRNINSKFSNLSPEAKKSTFEKMISKGSLKLQIMNDITTDNQTWKDKDCKEHEKEMIDLLQNAVKN